MPPSFDLWDTPIKELSSIGPRRAEIIAQELHIHTFRELLYYYPFRYDDRSTVTPLSDLTASDLPILTVGTITNKSRAGDGKSARIVLQVVDGTASLELVFFSGARYYESILKVGVRYLIFGKPTSFNNRLSLAHPELEAISLSNPEAGLGFFPVYSITEKMRRMRLDSRVLGAGIRQIIDFAGNHITDIFSPEERERNQLLPRRQALEAVHFPKTMDVAHRAIQTQKFEELYLLQIQLLSSKTSFAPQANHIIPKSGALVSEFMNGVLPFTLTSAQTEVLTEIYENMAGSSPMNRLLQGDVGSGKTVVAFISMLYIIDSGYQVCLLAPTEVLAEQHIVSLEPWCAALGITIRKLSGSSNKKERKIIDEGLTSGTLSILVGTHAIIEENVAFRSLGLCVIDEQHRFGVHQRAAVRSKSSMGAAHLLLMTATPIPRTLGLTLYGDLDISTIKQMPAGRRPIKTIHRYGRDREKIYAFIQSEIERGRQAYIVYPLIEASEKLNLKDLQEGFEAVKRNFPQQEVAMVHGRLKWQDKNAQMEAFKQLKAQILVATTVIEVGINIPNASVMVIENAERFGLAQLHQLRGRVGRGNDQSYCILLTADNLGQDSKERIKAMVESTDGFYLAEVDMRLRGSGNLMGTQQSGLLRFMIADLQTDAELLLQARKEAETSLADPHNTKKIAKLHVLCQKLNRFQNQYLSIG